MWVPSVISPRFVFPFLPLYSSPCVISSLFCVFCQLLVSVCLFVFLFVLCVCEGDNKLMERGGGKKTKPTKQEEKKTKREKQREEERENQPARDTPLNTPFNKYTNTQTLHTYKHTHYITTTTHTSHTSTYTYTSVMSDDERHSGDEVSERRSKGMGAAEGKGVQPQPTLDMLQRLHFYISTLLSLPTACYTLPPSLSPACSLSCSLHLTQLSFAFENLCERSSLLSSPPLTHCIGYTA